MAKSESNPSMFCPIHRAWKYEYDVDNPICLHCEIEHLQAKIAELKRAIEILQKKG